MARVGSSVQEVLVLAVIAGFLMAAYAGVAAVVSRFLPLKPPGRHVRLGWVMAAITFIQAALWYRFEWVLNLFVRDPRVWGGLLAIAIAAAAIGGEHTGDVGIGNFGSQPLADCSGMVANCT